MKTKKITFIIVNHRLENIGRFNSVKKTLRENGIEARSGAGKGFRAGCALLVSGRVVRRVKKILASKPFFKELEFEVQPEYISLAAMVRDYNKHYKPYYAKENKKYQ